MGNFNRSLVFQEMYASRILHPFILPLLATFEERIGLVEVIFFTAILCLFRLKFLLQSCPSTGQLSENVLCVRKSVSVLSCHTH